MNKIFFILCFIFILSLSFGCDIQENQERNYVVSNDTSNSIEPERIENNDVISEENKETKEITDSIGVKNKNIFEMDGKEYYDDGSPSSILISTKCLDMIKETIKFCQKDINNEWCRFAIDETLYECMKETGCQYLNCRFAFRKIIEVYVNKEKDYRI